MDFPISAVADILLLATGLAHVELPQLPFLEQGQDGLQF